MTATGKPLTPARVAILGACLIYAVLAMASGLDRMAASRPWLAARLPAALLVQGLAAKGHAALAAGDVGGAITAARMAVARAPVEPSSSDLLGQALYTSHDEADAEAAARVAASMGWRMPFTQAYWLQRALQMGDYPVAAMRLDALLRQKPELMAKQALMAPIEGSAEGRNALATRLIANPNWLTIYAGQVNDAPADVIRSRGLVLAEMARQGGVIGCDAIAPTVARLIDTGAVNDAHALWHAHCPDAGKALVYDGNFAKASIGQDASAFAWMFMGTEGLEMELDSHRLLVKNGNARPVVFMRQLVMLPPGSYRLSWRAEIENVDPAIISPEIRASLDCGAGASNGQPGKSDAKTGRVVLPLVVDAACPAHWLQFSLAPGSLPTSLSDITLEQVH